MSSRIANAAAKIPAASRGPRQLSAMLPFDLPSDMVEQLPLILAVCGDRLWRRHMRPIPHAIELPQAAAQFLRYFDPLLQRRLRTPPPPARTIRLQNVHSLPRYCSDREAALLPGEWKAVLLPRAAAGARRAPLLLRSSKSRSALAIVEGLSASRCPAFLFLARDSARVAIVCEKIPEPHPRRARYGARSYPVACQTR